MTFVQQIATRVTVLHFGAIFAEGTVVRGARPTRASREIYLGTAHVG